MRHNMHSWVRLALLLAFPACANAGGGGAMPDAVSRPSATASPAEARTEIDRMMTRAAAAWTRGDLEAFMSDYLDSDSTTYIGGNRLIRGKAAIRDVYAPRFAPGGVRDSLSFEGLEVDLLAPGIAHTIAFYVLSRGDSVVARGPTSLLMRQVGGRWLIVHDHSS